MRVIIPSGCIGLLLLLSLGLVSVLDAGEPALSESPTWSSPCSADLAGVALEDQFGKPHAHGFPADGPMVLLVADKKGYEALGPWIDARGVLKSLP